MTNIISYSNIIYMIGAGSKTIIAHDYKKP